MFGLLFALGALSALLWYLKAPRAVYLTIFCGTAALVLAARFLFATTHPVRVQAGDDLDGLVVVIFFATAVWAYRAWFQSLKRRRQTVGDVKAEAGFVLIADDLALAKDVERLLERDTFSILKRGTSGDIMASCRVRVEGGFAVIGSVYLQSEAPELAGLIKAAEDESCSRGAGMSVVELLAVDLKPNYENMGYTEFARLGAGAVARISMKKDLQ